MKVADIAAPLYHGTLRSHIQGIRVHGLLPQRGSLTRSVWGDSVPDLAYACEPNHRKRILDAIHHHVAEELGKGMREVTAEDIVQHGAVAVIQTDAWKFKRADRSGTPHASLETGDYYSPFPVAVDEFIEGDDLHALFRYWLSPTRDEFAVDDLAEMAAGPSRITQHIRNGMPFITVSAMRGTATREQNLAADAKLRNTINALPVSYIPIQGQGEELDAEGNSRPSVEKSYFIMPYWAGGRSHSEKLKSFGLKLIYNFNQDSFLYGNGQGIYQIGKDNTEQPVGNAMTFDEEKIQKIIFYSEIKGRKFSFGNKSDFTDDDSQDMITYNELGKSHRTELPPLRHRPKMP